MLPSSRQRPRLLTAGYLTLDLIVRNISTHEYWHAAGGTCGNVSIFASSLGLDVSILGRVGEDQRGLHLLSELTAAGVVTDYIARATHLRTPGVVELIGGRGTHRFVFQCPICGTQLPKADVVSDKEAETVVDHIEEYEGFFFDRATSATLRLAEAAREAGLLVMFEPTSVPRTSSAMRAAALSDILKVSYHSGVSMGAWRPNRGASTRIIIETLGNRGVRVRRRSSRKWSPWREIPAFAQSCVRDTAGAGDWLTAGLLVSLLPVRGELGLDALLASIEYGQRLSAISLAFHGPNGALTALGSSVIDQIARGTAPIEASSLLKQDASPRRSLPLDPNLDCELCLTTRPPHKSGFFGRD